MTVTSLPYQRRGIIANQIEGPRSTSTATRTAEPRDPLTMWSLLAIRKKSKKSDVPTLSHTDGSRVRKRAPSQSVGSCSRKEKHARGARKGARRCSLRGTRAATASRMSGGRRRSVLERLARASIRSRFWRSARPCARSKSARRTVRDRSASG